MDPAQLQASFLQEAEDLLAEIEDTAVNLDSLEDRAEGINSLFRAFHTIKGSGSMFGFDAVAAFTHNVETVLDAAREGALPVTSELLGHILDARDHIKALLADPCHAGLAEAGSGIIASLTALAQGVDPAMRARAGKRTVAPSQPDGPQTWRIRFQPDPQLLLSGGDPLSLLRELRGLGQCSIEACTRAIPRLQDFDPYQCLFSWEIALTTTADGDAIRDVFIFVEDGSQIEIEAIASGGDEAASRQAPEIEQSPQPLTAQRPEKTPAPAKLESPKAEVVRDQKSTGATTARESSTRVPSEKLDRLVGLVGELVMNQSRLSQGFKSLELASLAGPVEEIERLVNELRDTVLGIRMMPIGSTFSRFKRLVRDLSTELGKEIELVTEGAETELDKTVLDQLGDPLVHLIRNSIDHGIEPVEERLAAGKSRRGLVKLSAVHSGSSVVVRIEDDGRGLNGARIRAKAIERGLIRPDAVMSDKEINQLIFLPGFSTASQITSVSGRGVGMDVVKRQIDALRGSISITTQLGAGTTMALTLPLTLAIIEGLLVEVCGGQFIIPLSLVLENVELLSADRSRANGRNVIAVRGELIPYIRLRDEFGYPPAGAAAEKIVIVQHGDERLGLAVDRVLGSHQTVIQSLGKMFRHIELVSGATIMGDGRVALILSIGGLVRSTNTGSNAE